MAAEGATPLLNNLPDEIVIWEILVRLDPKSLLHCRAVRRAWRCATDSHILSFDHRAAQPQFHMVARHDEPFILESSCDGLLLSRTHRPYWSPSGTFHSESRLAVYNPATGEHAYLGLLPWGFSILGMYPHRPTAEYRLLLTNSRVPEYQIGCYVLTLGSDQPLRYIGHRPACFVIALHWFPVKHRKHVLVFDTEAESFRHMRAPFVLGGGDSGLLEMDGTLSIHILDDDTEIVNIWVLQDYRSEVWDLKYRIKLPAAEIREQFEDSAESWDLDVVSQDGDVFLLVNFGGWLVRVDSDGKLIDSFSYGDRELWMYEYRLKQSLVQHTLFPRL
ncbi:hypothetical protein VPH35_055476 [Triticum aestivum]